MESVANKIETMIEGFGRGKIFFAEDFYGIGSDEAVRQNLKRLTSAGKIMRVAQGIYCYPELDEKLGLGTILPSYEQIAKAIAQRDRARIVPSGEYALNVLGLSTQVPMNYVFLTDGPARHVDISNGRGITFKRVAPKNLSFSNNLAMLITSALRSIKRENVTEEQKHQVGEILRNENKESVMADILLMPAWIRNIVKVAYQ